MESQSTSTNSAQPPFLSPGKLARFSELVSIITSTSMVLQEEFDFLTPEAWGEILDQMFPGVTSLETPEENANVAVDSATGRRDPSGVSQSIRKILESAAAREIAEMEKGGKAGSGSASAPSARSNPEDLSEAQRKQEWSLMIRYGDPRAYLSPENYAWLAVAFKRWWNFSPPLSILKMARKAAEAQYKLVGSFGPGMLPFSTAVWQKATYDAQCDMLKKLKETGDAKGVTAMEAFLGRGPPATQDSVFFVRQTAQKTTIQDRSKPKTQQMQDIEASKKRKAQRNPWDSDTDDRVSDDSHSDVPAPKRQKQTTRRSSAQQQAQQQAQQTDSDSGFDLAAPVRQKPAATRRPAQRVISGDPDSDDQTQPQMTSTQSRPSLIIKLKLKPATSDIPIRSRPNTAAPSAGPANPRPQSSPPEQEQHKCEYRIEADLTPNPRVNAFSQYLISCFAVEHKRLLTRSSWALEKLRRYALGKEPHIKGPGKTSMREINFFVGKDLWWSISGFQLDQITVQREEAKNQWEAHQRVKEAVARGHDLMQGEEGHAAGPVQTRAEEESVRARNDHSSEDEAGVAQNKDMPTAPFVHTEQTYAKENTAVREATHEQSSDDDEHTKAQDHSPTPTDDAIYSGSNGTDRSTSEDAHMSNSIEYNNQDAETQTSDDVPQSATLEDPFDVFTTINNLSSRASTDDEDAASQLHAELRVRSVLGPQQQHHFRLAGTALHFAAPIHATATQNVQMHRSSDADTSSFGSRMTTPPASTPPASSSGAADGNYLTYEAEELSDEDSEYHGALSTTSEVESGEEDSGVEL